MITFIFFIICFSASTIGAICGIGGGVIIKPVLDLFGVLSVSTISFLSGLTVLSMTSYSVIKSRLSKKSSFSIKTGLPLSTGAAIGGVLGKILFSTVQAASSDPNRVGMVQSVCLAIVTFGTLLYTINKSKIHTLRVENPLICTVLGLMLGIMSSFLGIGGGPINLVVLYFFFSMPTKVASENSLYCIFFSQLANLIYTVARGKVPSFEWPVLILMVAGGILGGIAGRRLNSNIKDTTVDKLFIGLMAVIIAISIYNAAKFC